jgi:hypothetical protein
MCRFILNSNRVQVVEDTVHSSDIYYRNTLPQPFSLPNTYVDAGRGNAFSRRPISFQIITGLYVEWCLSINYQQGKAFLSILLVE